MSEKRQSKEITQKERKQRSEEERKRKGKGEKKEETVSLLSIPKKDILVRGEGRRRNGNNH